MSLAECRRPARGAAWIALALLVAVALPACGRYGPPRRAPQYREGYVPPAAAAPEASAEAEAVPPDEGDDIVEEEVPQP